MSRDDELYHYGVLGMRWGIRKDRGSSSSSLRKKYRQHKINKKRKKSLEKARKAKRRRQEYLKDPVKLYRHRDEFSTEEIRNALDRLNTEQKLHEASIAKLQRGAKYVETLAKYSTPTKTLMQDLSTMYKLATVDSNKAKEQNDKVLALLNEINRNTNPNSDVGKGKTMGEKMKDVIDSTPPVKVANAAKAGYTAASNEFDRATAQTQKREEERRQKKEARNKR